MAGKHLIRSAWPTLGLLCGLNLLNYLDRYILSAVLTPMQQELHLTDTAMGWAGSAFMLGYFIFAPFFGYLGDRYPRKWLMLFGVVGWSLATAATGLARSFPELILIRIFVGIGEACFVTMSPSWISDLFAGPRRNTAISLFYVAIPVGSALGFLWGGLFSAPGAWRDAFWWAGLPGVVLAMTLLAMREPRRGEADGVTTTTAPPRPAEIISLFGNSRYLLLVGGYTAQTFALGAFGIWGPAFLHREHGWEVGAAATLFGGILAGTGLVATLLGCWIANRLRQRSASGYVWLMCVSIFAAIPFCWLALTAAASMLSVTMLGVSMLLLFLPTGPITSEMLAIVPVQLRASAVALCTFAIHLFGNFISPGIVGHVSEEFHSLRAGVLLLPGVLLIGAILWAAMLFRPTRETA